MHMLYAPAARESSSRKSNRARPCTARRTRGSDRDIDVPLQHAHVFRDPDSWNIRSCFAIAPSCSIIACSSLSSLQGKRTPWKASERIPCCVVSFRARSFDQIFEFIITADTCSSLQSKREWHRSGCTWQLQYQYCSCSRSVYDRARSYFIAIDRARCALLLQRHARVRRLLIVFEKNKLDRLTSRTHAFLSTSAASYLPCSPGFRTGCAWPTRTCPCSCRAWSTRSCAA
jgi:hypothetical protein